MEDEPSLFKPGAVLTVFETDGFPAAAALLTYIVKEATDQHKPTMLPPAAHSFIHGIWAAIGILIDPPTADAGVLAFDAYTKRGFARSMEGKP